MGFLTESSLLPRKAKPIAVGDESVSLLRSLVTLTERSLSARRDGSTVARSYKRGRSDVDVSLRRKNDDGLLGMGTNVGVSQRAAADDLARETPAQRLAAGRLTLEAKVRAIESVGC